MIHRPLIVLTSIAALCLGGLLAPSLQAALHDRGGGLIYDDVLDVTWLQDAAYHVTSNAPNVDPNGNMTWQDATDWASALVYTDTVRNVDWDDWRLPDISPIGGTAYDLNYSFQGLTDNGYSITSPASELSYMYFVNLSGVPLVDTSGNFQPGAAGIPDPTPFTGLGGATWSRNDLPTDTTKTFVVGMGNGHQNWFDKTNALSVWLVRDGDVAIQPDGDLNADGLVNTADLLIGYQLVRGERTLTASMQLHGDVAPLVNGLPAPDGQFTLADLHIIERKAQGRISFP